jgi:hypothetical protein
MDSLGSWRRIRLWSRQVLEESFRSYHGWFSSRSAIFLHDPSPPRQQRCLSYATVAAPSARNDIDRRSMATRQFGDHQPSHAAILESLKGPLETYDRSSCAEGHSYAAPHEA